MAGISNFENSSGRFGDGGRLGLTEMFGFEGSILIAGEAD